MCVCVYLSTYIHIYQRYKYTHVDAAYVGPVEHQEVLLIAAQVPQVWLMRLRLDSPLDTEHVGFGLGL